MDRQALQDAVSQIQKANNIVVVSHQRPDADAYGSSCALTLGLSTINKKALTINESGIVERYLPIPGVSLVKDTIPSGDWDLCVVCDCGALSRVGDRLYAELKKFKNTINIDHHSGTELFGTVNLLDHTASSTSELVYHLLTTLGVTITKDIATGLLAGIIGDTGFFRYDSTKAETFRLAQQLTQYGASPSEIAKDLFASISLNALKFQSATLMKVEVFADGKIAELVVPQSMYAEYGVECEDADVLVDRIRDVEGIELAALIRQDNDIWRISLRAKTSKYDVATVAGEFGGGGHRAAAGFRWRKDIETLKVKLREALQRALLK